MKRECEYCGHVFSGRINTCPKCGATEFKEGPKNDNIGDIGEIDLEMEAMHEENQNYFDQPIIPDTPPPPKPQQNNNNKILLYLIIGIYCAIMILRFLYGFFAILT